MNSDTHYLKRHSELRQQLTNKDGSLASRLTQALADMLVMGRPSLTVILQNTQYLFSKHLKKQQQHNHDKDNCPYKKNILAMGSSFVYYYPAKHTISFFF